MAKQNSDKFLLESLIIFLALAIFVYILLFSVLASGKKTTSLEAVAQPVISNVMSPGEKIVTTVCIRCHGYGLMRAPKLGNLRDWKPRIEKGLEVLYSHAINGFNKMPPRGGKSRLTDEQIQSAVNHMVSLAKDNYRPKAQ